jgi:hypothetical protein
MTATRTGVTLQFRAADKVLEPNRVCGGIALASAILALIFLPRRAEGTLDAAATPGTPGVPSAVASGASAAVDINAGEKAAERAEWKA